MDNRKDSLVESFFVRFIYSIGGYTNDVREYTEGRRSI